MNKFLFTDGTNGVKEVQSQEELENLIESAAQPDKIRVWQFSSNEWISYATYRKLVPAAIKKERPATGSSVPTINRTKPANRKHWLKKIVYTTCAAAGIFLIFNFTKIKWTKAEPVNTSAARPANVPFMDVDSLISEIEEVRGILVDKYTRNNLRLRNTWPDRILLQLTADKETSSAGSRFFNVDISIDNTSGFNLDNAVVKLSIWKNKEESSTDTLQFNTIQYDKIVKRQSEVRYKGDSISVSFESIKAKAFNFCYSAATKKNSGNYNDRWFCRE